MHEPNLASQLIQPVKLQGTRLALNRFLIERLPDLSLLNFTLDRELVFEVQWNELEEA